VKKSSSNPPNPPKRLYGFWFHNPRLIFNVGAYDRLLVQEVGPFGVFYESWYLCFAIIESKRLECLRPPGVRFRFVALWNQYDKWVWCQKYSPKKSKTSFHEIRQASIKIQGLSVVKASRECLRPRPHQGFVLEWISI
jgi:hypothetical protein